MPQMISTGIVPGGNPTFADNFANLLQAGLLGNKEYQDEKSAKQDKVDQNILKLIEVGMNAKTVRPVQPGEKGDLSYKGNSFVYDNSANEDERKMNRYLNARKFATQQMEKEDASRANQNLPPLDDNMRNQRIEKYTALNMGGKLNADGSVTVNDDIKSALPDGLQSIWDGSLVSKKEAPITPAAVAKKSGGFNPALLGLGAAGGWLATKGGQSALTGMLTKGANMLPQEVAATLPGLAANKFTGAAAIGGAQMINPGLRGLAMGAIPTAAKLIGGAGIGIPAGQIIGNMIGNSLPVDQNSYKNNPLAQMATNQGLPLWLRAGALGVGQDSPLLQSQQQQ